MHLGVLQKEEVNGQSCDRGRSEGEKILHEAEVLWMTFYRGITVPRQRGTSTVEREIKKAFYTAVKLSVYVEFYEKCTKFSNYTRTHRAPKLTELERYIHSEIRFVGAEWVAKLV